MPKKRLSTADLVREAQKAKKEGAVKNVGNKWDVRGRLSTMSFKQQKYADYLARKEGVGMDEVVMDFDKFANKDKAEKIHSNRSKKARTTDESLRAPIPKSFDTWRKNPNRYDWPGIDTPTSKRGRTKKKKKKRK